MVSAAWSVRPVRAGIGEAPAAIRPCAAASSPTRARVTPTHASHGVNRT